MAVLPQVVIWGFHRRKSVLPVLVQLLCLSFWNTELGRGGE